MIQSMTGFGSAEQDGFRIDIRSLNHRYLDISVKLPSYLIEHEMAFRSVLRSRFSRGKMDVSVTVANETGAGLTVNTAAAGLIYRELSALKRECGIPGEVDINTVAVFRDLFITSGSRCDVDRLMAAFELAVGRLAQMRDREGETLGRELGAMVDELSAMNQKVKALAAAVAPEMTRRMREKLQSVLEGREVDEARVVQEAALIAVKLDIAEELSRIESHVAQFRETLASGAVVGRKLDFLAQELNREVNTIGSKAADPLIINETVAMKTCIERIKEQVQNVQ